MKYTFFAIPILLVLCIYCFTKTESTEQSVDKLTLKTAEKLYKKEGLVLIGTGGGMIGGIQRLNMSFQFFHKVDLVKSRQLVVSAVQQYLADINSNEKIRPYLHAYPFTPKDVSIRIWVYQPDRTFIGMGNIQYFDALGGNLEYHLADDPKDTKIGCNVLHEETYEQALKILKKANEPPENVLPSNQKLKKDAWAVLKKEI